MHLRTSREALVLSCSRLSKIGDQSGWYNALNYYDIRILFILVYYYVLTTQMDLPIIPTIKDSYNLVHEQTVDYNQSMAGSFIVEILLWIYYLSFSFLLVCLVVWSFLMMSVNRITCFFSDGYFCEMTSQTMSWVDQHRNDFFRSTYGYDPTLAIDERYLLFSGIMLRRDISYVFSYNAKWQVYVMYIRQQYEAIILLPLTLSTSTSPLWPPNGFIMTIMVFLFIVGVHFFILLFGIPYALFFRLKKLTISFKAYSKLYVKFYG